VKRFYVAAGHGGGKPGNTWGGYNEADLMTELRFIVAMKLRAAGHTVTEDGARGENMPLSQAVKLIGGHDLAIELHTNALNERSAGVEVVASAQHAEAARRISHAIGGVLQIPTRRDGGWFSLESFRKDRGFTPAFVAHGGLIVEVFFQSNPRELAVYLERQWLVASAIARAMQA
jgi:N-acetylmuramoyl-L-alanine amidase